MIEGLILAGELLVFGLLLWNVRQLDGKGPTRTLGVFDMTDCDATRKEAIKPKVPHA
jgi:hypothetical protein